jgi:hypothetical protein
LTYLNVPPKGVAPVAIVRSGATGSVSRPAGRAALDEPDDRFTMPSLVGRSLRQAIEALATYDVTVEVRGRGIVTAQLPLPGSALSPGAVCRLTASPPPHHNNGS